jgi:hypothetical protein
VLSVVRIDRVLDVIDRNARDITRVLLQYSVMPINGMIAGCRGATLASFVMGRSPSQGKMHCRMHGAPRGRHRAAINTR